MKEYFEIDKNMVLSALEGNALALTMAFDWEDSQEGFDYWQDVFDSRVLSNEVRLKLEGYMNHDY